MRFDSVIVSDAIFGLIYNSLKETYPNTKKLDILQLPESIRSSDPELSIKPHYQLSNDTFIFQVGPKVISLASTMDYVGWGKFIDEILRSFKIIEGLQIINKVERIGLRYINFFDFDIFEKINLSMNLNDSPLKSKQTSLRYEIPADDFVNILQIVNHAKITIKNEQKTGSVIDIDTILNVERDDFLENMVSLLEDGHTKEKELFFSLLKPEFLETLNPEY